MVKLKVKANMSNVLDKKYRLNASCPVKTNTSPTGYSTRATKQVQVKVIASNNSVIKSVNWGTSCPRTWNKPMSKRQDKQTMNNLNTLLFTICVAFYYEVHHWMFTLVRCKFPPWMMHGLGWRPRRLSSHLYPLLKLTKFPHLFGTMISIHKQKYMISTKYNLVQCWKLSMCQHI